MSSLALAYAIVGVPINPDDFYHRKFLSIHRTCKVVGEGPYCSSCGNLIGQNEVIETRVEGYDPDGGDGSCGSYKGLEMINAHYGGESRYFLAYTYAEDDSYRKYQNNTAGPEKLSGDIDLALAKEMIKQALEPIGLWKPEDFGIWAVAYYS